MLKDHRRSALVIPAVSPGTDDGAAFGIYVRPQVEKPVMAI
jgi:hypothetical protein